MKKRTLENTKKIISSTTLIILFSSLLIACVNTSNDTPPKPILGFKSSSNVRNIWHTNIGNGNGGQIDLTLTPAIENSIIYSSSFDGYISAVKAQTGESLWSTNTKLQLSAPIAVSRNLVITGSLRGKIVALDKDTGKIAWQTTLPSSLFSQPTIVNNTVYTQTHNGSVSAHNVEDGKQIWTQNIPTPNLMLTGNSSPIVYNGIVIAGTSSGSVWGLKANSGEKQWDNLISLTNLGLQAQKMVDITATPIMDNDTLYLITFEGNLISLNSKLGNINWQKKASAYRNIALGSNMLFTTDSKGYLSSYNLKTGKELWKATELEGRKPTAPLFLNGLVAVGDYKGYVHIFNADNGEYITHIKIDSNGINATPIAADKDIIVQTNSGNLAAIKF